MITLSDVNNELHVRLYILEVFKDYIRDDDFDGLVDKALDFVMEGVSMPKAPAKDTTMSDISKSVLALVAGAGLDDRLSKSSLELAYDRCKMRYVFDPRNRDIHGVVVGYSNDFNSLVAVCDEGSKKGVDKGSTDFVDVNERYVTNGFFYISVEDADKQSNYMGEKFVIVLFFVLYHEHLVFLLTCESLEDFLFLYDLNVLHNTYSLLESAT